MHHLDIDWLELARRSAAWSQLSLETRRVLLGLSSSDAVAIDRLGNDRSRLVTEQFVAIAGTGRVSLHQSHRAHARALRAMHRHDLLSHPTHEALAAYLNDQYTADERRLLVGRHWTYWSESAHTLVRHVASSAWLGPALDAALSATHADHDAGRVVRVILDRGGWMPVEDLPRVLDGVIAPANLSAAIDAAIRKAWLLATMRPDDLQPVLALWPPSVTRLLRKPATAPQPQVAGLEEGASFLMDDAAALLIAASSEPLRLRGSDGALFAKATERVQATLAPLPPLMRAVAGWNDEARIEHAVRVLRMLDCVRHAGRAGRDLRLEVTPAGRTWLARPPVERLRELADLVRPRTGNSAPRHGAAGSGNVEATSRGTHLRIVGDEEPLPADDGRTPGKFDDYDDDLDDYDDDLDLYDDDAGATYREVMSRHLDLLSRSVSPASLKDALTSAATAAYADRSDGYTDIAGFAHHHAEHQNPLFRRPPHARGYIDNIELSRATDEEREALWANMLLEVLLNRLLPFGGVVLGRLESGRPGFRVTHVGRYMLGLDRTFDASDVPGIAGARNDSAQIIIQPNFDVVFLAPAPAAEAEIGRLAERVGAGVGNLFRITRTAVFAAAAAGVTARAALATLQRLSSEPLPQNVAREVTGWFEACRPATAGTAYLLRFPDEATATRALAAAGRGIERIAPTILELLDPRQRTAVARKLRKQGIFVEEPDAGATHGRRRKHRRSY